MKSREFLEVLNKYNETDMRVMKENLKKECIKLYDMYGGRQGLAKQVGLEINAFQSCLNPSHSSILTFTNLIKFCGALHLDINDIFKPTEFVKDNRGVSKIWTSEKKQHLINQFEIGGVEAVKKSFNLSEKTIYHYYNLFHKS